MEDADRMVHVIIGMCITTRKRLKAARQKDLGKNKNRTIWEIFHVVWLAETIVSSVLSSFTCLVALLESESASYYPSLFLMENQKQMAQNEVDLSQQSKQPEFLSITTLSALITFYQSYNR